MIRAAPAARALAVTVGAAALAVAHDDWKAPAAERARVNPVPVSPMTLARGRTLYQKHCESCHGPQGKGDGHAAQQAVRPPHDLTDASVQAKMTDGEAFWKVSSGRRETGDVIMPAFATKIPLEDDRWKLVHFVRTLAPRP
jgi:mono/diheme cytochrome c family protein